MLGFIITLIVVGLIAGALARLIIPGRQNLPIPMTILLGIIGSFVGWLPRQPDLQPAAASSTRPGSSARSSAPSSCFFIYTRVRARGARA